MKRWWVSWYHTEDMTPFTLRNPWWISGYRMADDAACVCAAVMAIDDDHARQKIIDCYDEPPDNVEWRFVSVKEDDWSPFSDRFPKGDWMEWA